MPENALFQGCFTEVSFATLEGNQLSYFQNGNLVNFFSGNLLFTQAKLKIHVPCDISAHANLWVCLHCDDVVSICKWNLLLLFF